MTRKIKKRKIYFLSFTSIFLQIIILIMRLIPLFFLFINLIRFYNYNFYKYIYINLYTVKVLLYYITLNLITHKKWNKFHEKHAFSNRKIILYFYTWSVICRWYADHWNCKGFCKFVTTWTSILWTIYKRNEL